MNIRTWLRKEDLAAVVQAVRDAGQNTAVDIRIDLRQRRKRAERSFSLEQIARHEFLDLGMDKTSGRTGILIFVIVEERQFCILADEGVHALVPPGTWEGIANDMAGYFKQGLFKEGTVKGVKGVEDVLSRHVPRTAGDTKP